MLQADVLSNEVNDFPISSVGHLLRHLFCYFLKILSLIFTWVDLEIALQLRPLPWSIQSPWWPPGVARRIHGCGCKIGARKRVHRLFPVPILPQGLCGEECEQRPPVENSYSMPTTRKKGEHTQQPSKVSIQKTELDEETRKFSDAKTHF